MTYSVFRGKVLKKGISAIYIYKYIYIYIFYGIDEKSCMMLGNIG